ncbi:hypothetical protein ACFX2J_031346 [Malus domestica]
MGSTVILVGNQNALSPQIFKNNDSPLTDRTGGLWRLASSFLISFSTASQNPTSDAASQNPTSDAASPSSASKKPKRKKKKKNLFEVAQFLPNWGLGYRMAKTHWVGVSYQITKINIYKEYGQSGNEYEEYEDDEDGEEYDSKVFHRHYICMLQIFSLIEILHLITPFFSI